MKRTVMNTLTVSLITVFLTTMAWSIDGSEQEFKSKSEAAVSAQLKQGEIKTHDGLKAKDDAAKTSAKDMVKSQAGTFKGKAKAIEPMKIEIIDQTKEAAKFERKNEKRAESKPMGFSADMPNNKISKDSFIDPSSVDRSEVKRIVKKHKNGFGLTNEEEHILKYFEENERNNQIAQRIAADNHNGYNGYSRTQILSDDFSYSDGSLIGNGNWVHYSGSTDGQVQVSNGTVLINDSDSEDVRAQFAPITSGMLYFGIDVTLADPGSYTGTDFEYFIGFSDTTGYSLIGRVDAAALSATGWSPGVSNGSGAADATWASELNYATTYRIVVGTDASTASTDLWVDPASSSDTKISGTGAPSFTQLSGLFFRQASATPNLSYTLDNLVVSDTFSDVITTTTPTGISEGFEGTFPPTGWTNTTITGHAWEQSSSYTNSGSYSAKYKGSTYAGYQGELITPRLNLTTSSTDSLTYYLKNDAWTPDQNECDVYVSTDLGTTWTLITSHNTDVSSFTRFAHNLEGYTQNDSVYIKFLGEDNWGWGVYLDDLTGPPVWVDTEPVANLGSSSIDFGTVNTSSSSSKTVVLTNSGGGDLTGTITSDATEFTVGTATINVAPSASDTITITYTPSAESAQSGNIVFTHNGASSPDTISVSGTGTTSLLVEGFENGAWTGSPAAPPGWSQITVSGTNVWVRYNYNVHTGSYVARGPWASAGGEHLLITPGLDLSDGTSSYMLVFWLDGNSNSGTDLYVQISSSNSSDAGFTNTLATYIAGSTMPSTFAEQRIDLTGYTGTQYLAFRMVDADGYSVYIDDIDVELIPATPAISMASDTLGFGSIAVGVQTASLGQIVSNSGAADATVTAVTITGSSAFTTSYASGTIPAAGSDTVSITYTPTAAGSDTATVMLTITENFSGDSSFVVIGSGYVSAVDLSEGFEGGSFPPDNWNTTAVVGSGTWSGGTTAGSANSGSGYAYFNSSSGNQGALFTPLLDLSGYTTARLSFYYKANTWLGDQDSMHVYASSDAGATWTQIDAYTTDHPSYEQKIIDLDSGYNTATTQIQFLAYDGWGYGVYLDDVVIDEAPLTPAISISPSGLVFQATALGSTDTLKMFISNSGGASLNGAAVTYPTDFSGPATIDTIAAGGMDSITVYYTPTLQGLAMDSIVVDGSASGATAVNVAVEANAGDLAHTFVSSWSGWDRYDFFGPVWSGYSGSWEWYGGAGHSTINYAGVGTAASYWGGSDDWMVSRRLAVESGDVFSFWALSSSSTGAQDTMAVYVSTSPPELNDNDTGFVNMTDFIQLSDGAVPLEWTGYEFDLSTYAGDTVYLMIQSHGAGWYLQVDDMAHPNIWVNPNPVFAMGADTLDFGSGLLADTDGSDIMVAMANYGAGDLTYTTAADNSAFSVTPASGTIDSLGMDTLTINFAPADTGMFSGHVVITHNGASSPDTIYVMGEGIDAALAEGFEGTIPPEGWAEYQQEDANDGWEQTAVAHSGSNSVYHDDNNVASGIEDWLVTGVVHLENYANAELSFWQKNSFMTLYYEYHGVYVSTVGGDPATDTTWVELSEESTDYSDWTETLIDLSAYDGQAIYLAFMYKGDWATNWYLDDVLVKGDAPNNAPSAVSLTAPSDGDTVVVTPAMIAAGDTDISMQWTQSTDADGDNISYILILGIDDGAGVMVELVDTVLTADSSAIGYLDIITAADASTVDVSSGVFTVYWDVLATDGEDTTTSSNGPFMITIDGGWFLSVDGGSLIPDVFSLHQNYPNPFNPVTTIRYDVPEASLVKMVIYDVLGRKVRTLVHYKHQPGYHAVIWNGNNDHGVPVATGMYIYRITAESATGNFTSVKKLIMMK